MADQQVDFSEILITPLSQMIQKIAHSVAEAQRVLDTTAVETQKNLKKNYPALDELGYQVAWYHMPEVVVDLKLAVHLEQAGKGKEKDPAIQFAPYNAKYKNVFSYEAEGASSVRLRIVPVPAPLSAKLT